MRRRLILVSPSMATAVRFAGGWLFDLVMAGWDATVLTADQTDSRPVRILGAHAVDLESELAASACVPGTHVMAVDAELYASDTRVRLMVLDAVAEGVAEVRLWADRWPKLEGQAAPVQHRLSVAARAFKAQALAAAAADCGSSYATEMFRSSARPNPVGPDLVPTALGVS